jgi:hypothetical protein
MMPRHSVFLSGGKSWLVVEAQDVSGSGVALYSDHIFAVDNHSVKEVLSYPAEGHQEGSSYDPARDFSARIIGYEKKNDRATFKVEFTVTYSSYGLSNKEITICSKKQNAVYVQQRDLGKYRLDVAQSDLSIRESESVYNIDSLSGEEFLRYNHNELMKIARGRNKQSIEWLSNYLDQCLGSPHKNSCLYEALTTD